MHWGVAELLALALALAMDAFSVGLVVGLTHRRADQIFRLAWHFGVFQALMPLIGALLSGLVREHAVTYAPYIAFALLAGIGGNMLHEAARGGMARRHRVRDRTRGLSLIGLSLAVSIDALGAGVSLGLGGADLPLAVGLIGVAAALLTLVGMVFGSRLQGLVGRKAEYLGGVVLIALGLRMLWPAL